MAYYDVVDALNPTYWWRLDGNQNDSADSANSDTSTPPDYVDSIIPAITATNQCGDYNGSNDKTGIPNQSDINSATTYRKSISVWVEADTIDATGRIIWGEGGATNGLALYVVDVSGEKRLYLNVYESTTRDYIYAVISTGTVYHIGATLDCPSGTLYIYINGEVAASKTGGLNISTSFSSHAAGAGFGGADSSLKDISNGTLSGYFEGRIADVAYWAEVNPVLDGDDFSEIYVAGLGSQEYTQTVTAKANIKNRIWVSVYSKGSIQKESSQSVSSKGRIEITTEKTISAKGFLIPAGAGLGVQTIIARGSIKKESTHSLTALGSIKKQQSTTVSSTANIRVTIAKTIEAGASIRNQITRSISALGSIKRLAVAQIIEVGASIKNTLTQSISAKSRIEILTGKTIQAKAKIICISRPILVTPEQFSSQNSTLYLVWEIPSCCLNKNMHAHVQVDKTDNTFGDLEIDSYSFRDSNFEYWDGDSWEPYPIDGVTSVYYGNQARLQVTLTDGDKNWRVKGGVT